MCTLYETFYNEVLKNISSITSIYCELFYKCLKNVFSQTLFLELFLKSLINVFRKNILIENVYKTLLKHYRVNTYLEMFGKS